MQARHVQVFDPRSHPVGDAIEWRRLLGVSWQLVLDGADHHLQPAPPQIAAQALEDRSRLHTIEKRKTTM